MFQHTERRVELGCEQQRDMEQAFEGLFVKTHGKQDKSVSYVHVHVHVLAHDVLASRCYIDFVVLSIKSFCPLFPTLLILVLHQVFHKAQWVGVSYM